MSPETQTFARHTKTSKSRAADEVYATLKNEILTGEISPGELLSENEIAKRFSISRTPVREALNKLACEGLTEVLPQAFGLAQNSPNPFSPLTTLAFALPEAAHVRLSIYDLGGRLVRVLVDEVRPAGMHEVQWDATNASGQRVASGVYLCRMEAGEYRETRRVMLIK